VFVSAPWLIRCFFTASWSLLEERIIDNNLRFIFPFFGFLCVRVFDQHLVPNWPFGALLTQSRALRAFVLKKIVSAHLKVHWLADVLVTHTTAQRISSMSSYFLFFYIFK
jgi:hypothetical protein